VVVLLTMVNLDNIWKTVVYECICLVVTYATKYHVLKTCTVELWKVMGSTYCLLGICTGKDLMKCDNLVEL